MSAEKVNVICMKWGTFYGPEFVNRLYFGVRRHLRRPFRFVCFTNEPEGLVEGVEVQPIPAPPDGYGHSWPTVYAKLSVFRAGFGGLSGPTMFLDIDQIIVGDLDRFFDYRPGEFCIIHNWIERRKRIFRRRPAVGNSSCFRFEAGSMDAVWRRFAENPGFAHDKKRFATEQAFMTFAVRERQPVNWWPEEWVLSFKRACHRVFPLNLWLMPAPPRRGSILCFHGAPSPHEAIPGYTEHRGRKAPIHQRTRPAPWIADLWECEAAPVEKRSVLQRGRYINDVLYTGVYEGVECVEKHSCKAVWSIGNEYRLLRKLHALAPASVPRPLAWIPDADGRGASVVTERLAGPSLAARLRAGDIGDGEADGYARDIRALADALRRADVVHRDLMEDNLLLGGDGHLKAIDWQLGVERGDFREDPWVRRHWKFRYVVFGVNRELGLGVWNDCSALRALLAQLPQTPAVRETDAHLAALEGAMTVVDRPGAVTRLKLRLYALSLRLQMLFRRRDADRLRQLRRRCRTIVDGLRGPRR